MRRRMSRQVSCMLVLVSAAAIEFPLLVRRIAAKRRSDLRDASEKPRSGDETAHLSRWAVGARRYLLHAMRITAVASRIVSRCACDLHIVLARGIAVPISVPSLAAVSRHLIKSRTSLATETALRQGFDFSAKSASFDFVFPLVATRGVDEARSLGSPACGRTCWWAGSGASRCPGSWRSLASLLAGREGWGRGGH